MQVSGGRRALRLEAVQATCQPERRPRPETNTDLFSLLGELLINTARHLGLSSPFIIPTAAFPTPPLPVLQLQHISDGIRRRRKPWKILAGASLPKFCTLSATKCNRRTVALLCTSACPSAQVQNLSHSIFALRTHFNDVVASPWLGVTPAWLDLGGFLHHFNYAHARICDYKVGKSFGMPEPNIVRAGAANSAVVWRHAACAVLPTGTCPEVRGRPVGGNPRGNPTRPRDGAAGVCQRPGPFP